MADVTVKRLSAGDEAEVTRFDEAFDRAVDPGFTARYLADERHHLLVAYVDGESAGIVSATEILHPDKPTELFLSELAVVSAKRHRGAATALLAELKLVARERGCASIWVLTSEDNEAAVATYRGAGGEWDGANSVMFEIPLTS
ncbi:MAG TPA: GNAT family N-acetyltransferase [Actinomycetota bacterium]|nr:GNAT family N-acetyltransferase [Actinomycetota bacterium]